MCVSLYLSVRKCVKIQIIDFLPCSVLGRRRPRLPDLSLKYASSSSSSRSLPLQEKIRNKENKRNSDGTKDVLSSLYQSRCEIFNNIIKTTKTNTFTSDRLQIISKKLFY